MLVEEQARVYEEVMGTEATERQVHLTGLRHACCWEDASDEHHVACRFRPPDPEPEPIDGQTALL